MTRWTGGLLCGVLLAASGCANGVQGNVGNMAVYPVPTVEAQWIRDGEPIEFEGELWYPMDMVDILLDSEVVPVADYRQVQVFIERIDVRPYHRLYTKFGRNKFRIFTKPRHD